MPSPITVELRAVASDFTAKLHEAQAEIAKTGESAQGMGTKLAGVGGAVAAGLGGAAVAVGAFALDMADKFEAAHARLTAAISASGASWDQYKGQIGSVESKMEALGFTHAQVEDALAHSVVSTQNVGKSLSTMGLAADLARMKNIDLTTATDALDKAMTGNLRPLKQLGIDLPVTATNALKLQQAQDGATKATAAVTALLAKHSDAMQAGSKYHAQYEAAVQRVTAAQQKLKDEQSASGQILDALNQRLGGQASAYMDTFAGKVAGLKAKMADWGAHLGMVLIPVIEKLASTLSDVVGWLSKHQDVALALAAAIGGPLVAAFVAWGISMIGVVAEMLLFAAPFIALGAAIFGVVYAIEHWREILDAIVGFLKDVWKTIEAVVTSSIDAVVGFVKNWWPEILGVLSGGMLLLPALFIQHWDDIKRIFTEGIRAVVGFMAALPGKIVDAIGDLGSTLLKAGTDLLTGLWNGIKAVTAAEWHFWTDLPGKILSALGDTLTWLLQKGEDILTGLWNGIKQIWNQEVHFWTDLPGKITTAIGDALTWLVQKGDDILTGLWNGIKAVWAREVHFWSDLAGMITTAMGDATGWLLQKGEDILTGLWNGIHTVWSNDVAFFSQLPGEILKEIGDASQWLVNVGKQIIQGLINGIKSMAGDVAGAVGGVVGDAISALPGGGSIKSLGHSLGIPGFASGTPSAPGGLALVGEQGPELVNLPAGASVQPAGTTAALLSGSPSTVPTGSGGGGTISIQVAVGTLVGSGGMAELAAILERQFQRVASRNGLLFMPPAAGIAGIAAGASAATVSSGASTGTGGSQTITPGFYYRGLG